MGSLSGAEVSSLRVTKKLSVGSRGALKLARQFGEGLVCVRHRVDANGEYRYTTVELFVERSAIVPRVETLVCVRVAHDERPLQQIVKAAGAKWDPTVKLWRMPRRLAGILRLTHRIVPR